MPLPDAPPPSKSYLYSQLASKTALPGATGAITADLIDSFKNQLYLDENSEDELRRLLLLQMTTGTGSMSGPLMDSVVIHNLNSDTSGGYFFFTPGVGEIWQFMGASTAGQTTGGNTITYNIGLAPSTATGLEFITLGVKWINYGSSSTGSFPIIESDTNSEPSYVSADYPCMLYIEGSGFTNFNVNAAFARVR